MLAAKAIATHSAPAGPASGGAPQAHSTGAGASLAYAAQRIVQRDPEATMVVAPADHLIEDEAGFRDVLSVAVNRASETNQLLTLGITPTRPDTGYGYIQYEDLPDAGDDRLRQVRTFTEKPDRELAEQFLASGDFCWNAGIFVWSVQTILDRFEDQMPDLHALFDERKADLGTRAEEEAILAIYGAAENISIDYGIMEKAPNVGVVLSDCACVSCYEFVCTLLNNYIYCNFDHMT